MRTKTPIRIVERLTAAHKEMSDAVSRQWHRETALKISIPARPSHDSDMIICGAIREAESVIEGLYDALDEAQYLFAHGIGAIADLGDKANQDRNADEAKKILDKVRAALARARGEGQ